MTRQFSRLILVGLVFALILQVQASWGKEIFYDVPLKNLVVTNGDWPETPSGDDTDYRGRAYGNYRRYGREMFPYVVGDSSQEMYLTFDHLPLEWSPRDLNLDSERSRLVVRVDSGEAVSGRMYLPKVDWSGMSRVDIRLESPPGDQEAARNSFFEAKEKYYKALTFLDLPGGAWFRHQQHVAHADRIGEPTAWTRLEPVANAGGSSQESVSDLDRTFGLFTGGRAISENLQLDRTLNVFSKNPDAVSVDSIKGITIAAINWGPLIAEKNPQKDPLASMVPEDQHALFFPSFDAMTKVMDEAAEGGTPILHLLEPRSEDARSKEKYQRQLCLSDDSVTRMVGERLIQTVAFTGSDPYLRTGSDIATLFETDRPTQLASAIAIRYLAAKAADAEVESVTGEVRGVPYNGVLSPDRSICSYCAALQDSVVVTNSVVQLERVVKTKKGEVPSLEGLEEYTFFRDRYPLGDPEETALLVVTDATIRRWCGPQWRIAASRRMRAAAVLSELQARRLEEIDSGHDEVGERTWMKGIEGLGNLTRTQTGFQSSVYGNLHFMTPLCEIPVKTVSLTEKNAYETFRENYQRNWRRFFDPIAVRLSVEQNGLALDLTVRPLVAATDYRDLIRFSGTEPKDHEWPQALPNSALMMSLSIDKDSEWFRRNVDSGWLIPRTVTGGAFGWFGNWIALHVDQDRAWDEARAVLSPESEVDSPSRFMEKNLNRLPVALHIQTENPLLLTGFLTALRNMVEQSAPGLTTWENLGEGTEQYVRITFDGRIEQSRYVLYYAPAPGILVITPHEGFLKRTLADLNNLKGEQTGSTVGTTLGENINIFAATQSLTFLEAVYSETLDEAFQKRSWRNLPILNEWHRIFEANDSVDFHNCYWGVRLVCPGGGEYVWNEDFQTYESAVYGHPGEPRRSDAPLRQMEDVNGLGLGLTFEDDGLRARARLSRDPRQ